MSLRKKYQPYFKMGAAIPGRVLKEESVLRHITEEYDSITCENDMKPENLLDAAANQAQPEKYDRNPALTFEKVEPYMDFAAANGIGVRGHTLVWHNQTPRWFLQKTIVRMRMRRLQTEKPCWRDWRAISARLWKRPRRGGRV